MLQKYSPIITKVQGLKGLHIVLCELLRALAGCEKESCSGTPVELCSSLDLLEMSFFLCAILEV